MAEPLCLEVSVNAALCSGEEFAELIREVVKKIAGSSSPVYVDLRFPKCDGRDVPPIVWFDYGHCHGIAAIAEVGGLLRESGYRLGLVSTDSKSNTLHCEIYRTED